MTEQCDERLAIFRFRQFAHLPVLHGITARRSALPGDGDINIAGRLPREQALENRRFWFDHIGVDPANVVSGRQAHGNGVQIVDWTHAGRGATFIEDALPATDALATREIGLPLMVYTADCVSIVIYDPVNHALGVAHAGWRGTTKNVAGEVVASMSSAFGSAPSALLVGIGPSIGPCCYEVGDEVIEAWRSLGLDPRGRAVRPNGNRFHLDLWRANVMTLKTAGVLPDRIEVSEICTKCHSEQYFSRRAGNGHRGLFATVAALGSIAGQPESIEEGRRDG